MNRISSHWFQEYLSPELGHQFAITQILYSGKTQYQSVEVVETMSFGRCLILDGKVQSSEADEFIYHEALVHPPLLLHPQPRTIFIAGGGEGATLREVLKHKSVQRVVMLDVDREVVELSQRFLPSWHQNAFHDPRLELHFSDARGFLAHSQENFDVVLMDITDPVAGGPSYLLFTREFYRLVRGRLTPEGILAVQAGHTRLPLEATFLAINRTLRKAFPVVQPYQAEIPSFGGGWGFALASQAMKPLSAEEIDQHLSQRLSQPLRFYDGITHQGMFSLPRHLRQKLAREGAVITDKAPHFTY